MAAIIQSSAQSDMRNSILHLPGMHNVYNHEDAQVNADYCLKHKSVIRANGKAEAQRGGAGRTGRHLLGGGKRAIIVFKNSSENSDCIISYVFACNSITAAARNHPQYPGL